MKYIRTKDKIEKVPNDYANKLVETPTLKIADTIEELCDEFVLVSGSNGDCNPFIVKIKTTRVGTKEVVFSDNSGHHSLRHHYLQFDNIYGAIWTDKGLIYVAKMNDKGELELL